MVETAARPALGGGSTRGPLGGIRRDHNVLVNGQGAFEMSHFPNDVNNDVWNADNLTMWQDRITGLVSGGLSPLEAKAWHAIGLLVSAFDAAGHLLYFARDGGLSGPKANHYLHTYLIACSAIELLARCRKGHENFLGRGPSPSANEALKRGFKIVRLVDSNDILVTNEENYTLDKLVALRNLGAHGMGVASARGRTRLDVFLHIELLDNFPQRLADAFDAYYRDLIDSSKHSVRENLARSGLQPVLYAERPGQAFISPIQYTYQKIIAPQRVPSDALQYKDWQVYKGDEPTSP
jgi:hypothetical protein